MLGVCCLGAFALGCSHTGQFDAWDGGLASRLFPLPRKGDAIICTRKDAEGTVVSVCSWSGVYMVICCYQ